MRAAIALLVVLTLAGCARPATEPSRAGSAPGAAAGVGVATSSPVDPETLPKRQYRPGGAAFKKAWDGFYGAEHESEIDDPLIAAGRDMTPAICEAIANKDMQSRRYAIGALGFIGDARAIRSLKRILEDPAEIDYVRGDALQAVYVIGRDEGTRLAQPYLGNNDMLGDIARAIQRTDPSLVLPTDEAGYEAPEPVTLSAASLEHARRLGGKSHEGETLHFVVGDSFDGEAEARAALEKALPLFGDMQTYLVVQHSSQFEGMRPGWWVVVEAYRQPPSSENLDLIRRAFPDAYVKQAVVRTADPIPVYEDGVGQ